MVFADGGLVRDNSVVVSVGRSSTPPNRLWRTGLRVGIAALLSLTVCVGVVDAGAASEPPVVADAEVAELDAILDTPEAPDQPEVAELDGVLDTSDGTSDHTSAAPDPLDSPALGDVITGKLVVAVHDDFTQAPQPSHFEPLVFTGADFIPVPETVLDVANDGDIVEIALHDDGAIVAIEVLEATEQIATPTESLIANAATAVEHNIVAVILTPPGYVIPPEAEPNIREVLAEVGEFWVNQTRNKITSFPILDVIAGAGKLTSCNNSINQTFVDTLKVYQPDGGWNLSNHNELPWGDNLHLIGYVMGCGAEFEMGLTAIGTMGDPVHAAISGGGIVTVHTKSWDRAEPNYHYEMNRNATAHEIGHNLGLGHADALHCTGSHPDLQLTGVHQFTATAPNDNYYHQASDSPQCKLQEYGDILDVMGFATKYIWGDVSAVAAHSIGIDVSPIRVEPANVPVEKIVTINTLSAPSGNRAIIIIDPITHEEYWIELRTPERYGNYPGAGSVLDNTTVKWDDIGYWLTSGLRVTKQVSGQHVEELNRHTALVLDRAAIPGQEPRSSFGLINGPLDVGNTFVSVSGGISIIANNLHHGATSASVTVILKADPSLPPPAPPALKTFTGGSARMEGTSRVGNWLTATTPTGFTPAPKLRYQWLRNGKPISGATARRYKLVAADNGKNISVSVTAYQTGYVDRVKVSGERTIKPGTFTPGVARIKGTLKVGNILTAIPSKFTPRPTRYKYQWFRGGTQIAGATGATYRLKAADVGKKISVSITAVSNGYADRSRKSPARGPVRG